MQCKTQGVDLCREHTWRIGMGFCHAENSAAQLSDVRRREELDISIKDGKVSTQTWESERIACATSLHGNLEFHFSVKVALRPPNSE